MKSGGVTSAGSKIEGLDQELDNNIDKKKKEERKIEVTEFYLHFISELRTYNFTKSDVVYVRNKGSNDKIKFQILGDGKSWE